MGDNMIGELNMYRESGIKPNFSDIARRYRRDRRTVAAYWKAAASGEPDGPSVPPRAPCGTGVPHCPRHPRDRRPFAVDFPMRPGKAPIAGHAFLRAGKPIPVAFPIKNGRRPAPTPKIGHAFSSHRPQWARPPRRGHARARTPDLMAASHALSQLS